MKNGGRIEAIGISRRNFLRTAAAGAVLWAGHVTADALQMSATSLEAVMDAIDKAAKEKGGSLWRKLAVDAGG